MSNKKLPPMADVDPVYGPVTVAPSAHEWQPIETAPRDGTPILLWCATDVDRYYCSGNRAPKMTIGFFGATDPDYGRQGVWCSVEAKEEMWGMGGELTGPMMSTDCIQVDPTHWMPLPEPPVS